MFHGSRDSTAHRSPRVPHHEHPGGIQITAEFCGKTSPMTSSPKRSTTTSETGMEAQRPAHRRRARLEVQPCRHSLPPLKHPHTTQVTSKMRGTPQRREAAQPLQNKAQYTIDHDQTRMLFRCSPRRYRNHRNRRKIKTSSSSASGGIRRTFVPAAMTRRTNQDTSRTTTH